MLTAVIPRVRVAPDRADGTCSCARQLTAAADAVALDARTDRRPCACVACGPAGQHGCASAAAQLHANQDGWLTQETTLQRKARRCRRVLPPPPPRATPDKLRARPAECTASSSSLKRFKAISAVPARPCARMRPIGPLTRQRRLLCAASGANSRSRWPGGGWWPAKYTGRSRTRP